MGPALKALKGKQRTFAQLFGQGDITGQDAAIGAGYGEKSARSKASQLLTNVNIIAAIEEIQKEAVSDSVLTRRGALEKLSEIARSGSNENVQIKAIDSLSKMSGWNEPEEVDHTHTIKERTKLVFKDMTEDEDE